MLHNRTVFSPVYLRTERMYRGALAFVEHAALQKTLVGRFAHLAAKGVYLPYKVAFGCAAYRRVARAVAYGVKVYGKNERRASEPCGGKPRLNARVPGAYYCDVVISGIIFQSYSLFQYFLSGNLFSYAKM